MSSVVNVLTFDCAAPPLEPARFWGAVTGWPLHEESSDEEVVRLTGIGAVIHSDLRRPDGTGWVVLTDPEGNEFCVERSAAER
jgi:hypothetical protein